MTLIQNNTSKINIASTQNCYVYCPYCGYQLATEGRSVRTAEYKWIKLTKEVQVYRCSRCGSEIPNPERDNLIFKEMVEEIKENYIVRNYNRNELQKKYTQYAQQNNNTKGH